MEETKVDLEKHITHAKDMIVGMTDVLIRNRSRYRVKPTLSNRAALQDIESNINLYKAVVSALQKDLQHQLKGIDHVTNFART